MKKLLVLLLLTVACAHQKGKEEATPIPEGEGCTLGLSGGVQSLYITAGFLAKLAKENIHIQSIVVTEAPAMAAVWYARRAKEFDIEWGARKFKLEGLKLTNWNFGKGQDKLIRNYIKKDLKAKYFKDLKVPITIYWKDRYNNKLIQSQEGTLKEPLLASFALPGLRKNNSAASGNESEILPGDEEVQNWIILHIDETLAGKDTAGAYWNAWRALVTKEVEEVAKKREAHLIKKQHVVRNTLNRKSRNKLYREGKQLAATHLDTISQRCGHN